VKAWSDVNAEREKNHVQYDDQQRYTDPTGQGKRTLLDVPGGPTRTQETRSPGNQQYSAQMQQAAGQDPGDLRQKGQQANACTDPHNPYGRIRDVIAEYSKQRPVDPNQQSQY
jgi:hypothetical protein